MDTDQTIKTVRIKNFMCYGRDTTFTFQPGVNAIVGANDRGKSTILAALGWVVFGKPSGDTVESWNGDRDTLVEITFGDGLTVGRYRKNGQNSYRLGDTVFKAMGNVVPDEISAVLNLGEINFQGQANNIYPMQLTAGEFGQVVNKHCRLDQIHETMKRVSSELRKWERQAAEQAANIQTLGGQLEKLAWVPETQGKLEVAEQLERKVTGLLTNSFKGARLVEQLQLVEEDWADKKNRANLLFSSVKTVREQYNKLNELNKTLLTTRGIVRQIEGFEADLEQATKVLSIKPRLFELKQVAEWMALTQEKAGNAGDLLRKVFAIEEQKNNALLDRDSAGQQIHDIRANLPPICPLCGAGNSRKKS